MSCLHSAERPRIYLDINGVLVVDNSPFELVSLNCIDKYSPEVARRASGCYGYGASHTQYMGV
jgi:hypothetical protein